MKKTFSLFGLLVVGLMLLANPATGILAETESEVNASVTTTTVSGDPPAESEDDDSPVSVVTTSTTEAESADGQADVSVATDAFSVIGSEEDSEFGIFQVEVFFEDGEIVAVEPLQLPTDTKSNFINNEAEPSYEEAVVAAQSTDIDVISGATVTWDNYTASVQSALDEVGFVA